MKRILKILAFALPALIFILAGCAKDTTSTENPTRNSFLGSWSVTEYYTKLTYEVIIVADPNSSDGVLISGFANTLQSGPYAGAVVAGSKITLDANQVIGDGIKVNGSGVLSGNKITWSYTIDDGANLLTANAVYTKI